MLWLQVTASSLQSRNFTFVPCAVAFPFFFFFGKFLCFPIKNTPKLWCGHGGNDLPQLQKYAATSWSWWGCDQDPPSGVAPQACLNPGAPPAAVTQLWQHQLFFGGWHREKGGSVPGTEGASMDSFHLCSLYLAWLSLCCWLDRERRKDVLCWGMCVPGVPSQVWRSFLTYCV